MHGLRGGGATDDFLRQGNVERLRRRGRWCNLVTIERYVQEGVYVRSSQTTTPQVEKTLREVSCLARRLFKNWVPAYSIDVDRVEGSELCHHADCEASSESGSS